MMCVFFFTKELKISLKGLSLIIAFFSVFQQLSPSFCEKLG